MTPSAWRRSATEEQEDIGSLLRSMLGGQSGGCGGWTRLGDDLGHARAEEAVAGLNLVSDSTAGLPTV
jgi:hypothetical protein